MHMVNGRQCSVYVDLATLNSGLSMLQSWSYKGLTEILHLDSQSPTESQSELTRSSTESENTNSFQC